MLNNPKQTPSSYNEAEVFANDDEVTINAWSGRITMGEVEIVKNGLSFTLQNDHITGDTLFLCSAESNGGEVLPLYPVNINVAHYVSGQTVYFKIKKEVVVSVLTNPPSPAPGEQPKNIIINFWVVPVPPAPES